MTAEKIDSNDDNLEDHPAIQQRWGLSEKNQKVLHLRCKYHSIWLESNHMFVPSATFPFPSFRPTTSRKRSKLLVDTSLASPWNRDMCASWRPGKVDGEKTCSSGIWSSGKLGKWFNLTIHLFSWFGPFRSFSYVMYIPIYWIFLTYISPLELAYMIILLFTKCSKSRLASALHASFILTPVEDGRIQKSCIHALNFPSNIVPWRLWVILSPHS